MHKPAPRDKIWTPDWVAKPMAEYVLADRPAHILDPAVGNGALLKAAKTIAEQAGFSLTCYGTEIDPDVLSQAGLSDDQIALADFLSYPFQDKFPAIIANPPYIRHHHIAPETKLRLQKLANQIAGIQIDGRAGLHVYFLIRALSLLSDGGRLAFIVSADVCEGKFANRLWRWITSHFALEAVVTFAPNASPFPQADVNPVILLIRNARPGDTFYWAKCMCVKPWSARQWLTERSGDDLIVIRRSLAEGVATGLSRPPSFCLGKFYRLGHFCHVIRDVASGANDFFFLTKARAAQIGIPKDYLVQAIVRTRDISGDEITTETIATLDRRGRPTFLLSIHPNTQLPPPVLAYLAQRRAPRVATALPDRPT
jgi:adenine-specific DNA-methyltransferase